MELSMRERRELDAEIAVKIFGWSDIEVQRNMVNNNRWGSPPSDEEDGYKTVVPAYTEKMDLAWRVVDKLQMTITLRQYPYNRAYVTFGNWDNSEDMSEANGRYCTPTAICLAAIAAVTQPNNGMHATAQASLYAQG